MNITNQQLDSAESGQPIELADNGKRFVLISGEVYDRMKNLLYNDSEWTDDELRNMLANSSEGNGWNEPGMEDYDSRGHVA